MLEPESHAQLRNAIEERLERDRFLLDQLRSEIRPLRATVRSVQPRTSTSISLVGTDGGNNRVQFDPFLVQMIRVVDSSNNEYCLEIVTPTTDVDELSAAQFDSAGKPRTALGEMMAYLGVRELTRLSPMIRRAERDRPISPTWIQVYRELVEWAILFKLVRNKDFGTDTLILYDGLLRSKVFSGELFQRYLQGIREGIEAKARDSRRKVFLAGMAKHSKVLSRYRLAMLLEGVLSTNYPAFVEVPRELEEKAYVWSEYARGDDRVTESGEANKFVGGKMFFVKFGSHARDPVWPVDIFYSQVVEAQTILGCLLADAVSGFPVPLYPLCLQRAHENASLVDFDFDVLQDQIIDGLRKLLGSESPALDGFRLQDSDPAQARYG